MSDWRYVPEDADHGSYVGFSSSAVEIKCEHKQWSCPECFTRNIWEWRDCAWCGRDRPDEG